MKTRYAPHRPQQKIFSLSKAVINPGTDGYGWHVNAIPIGSGYEDRHSDKVRINSLTFAGQIYESDGGKTRSEFYNIYVYLVRDNSGGSSVPKFSAICLMDNSNVSTAVVDHDSKDRFKIMKRYKIRLSGNASGNACAVSKVDFRKFIKINQETEFKSATDGSYTNTQKNAYVLYFVSQSYAVYFDGHVICRYVSIV